MKLSKILAVAALAALALMAFASTASAADTALETNGVDQSSAAVTIEATASSSITLESTSGVFANTCSGSTVKATTVSDGVAPNFTGPRVSGPISVLSFTNCTHSPVVVNSKGSLSIERIGTTTNGTVFWSGTNWTYPVTIFGSVVSTTCTTNNTDVGTLTGSSTSGGSKITLSAILECGGVLPSARWTGTYTITGHGIGVIA
jgi:hypothetical protein